MCGGQGGALSEMPLDPPGPRKGWRFVEAEGTVGWEASLQAWEGQGLGRSLRPGSGSQPGPGHVSQDPWSPVTVGETGLQPAEVSERNIT